MKRHVNVSLVSLRAAVWERGLGLRLGLFTEMNSRHASLPRSMNGYTVYFCLTGDLLMRPDEIVWDLRMIECHPI